MDKEKFEQIVQKEIETMGNPHELFEYLTNEYPYVYDLREDGFLRCGLGKGKIAHTIHSKAEKSLEKKTEKIAKYSHGEYKHTVGLLTTEGIKLLRVLDENNDLPYFLNGGWEGIFKQYISARINLLEFPPKLIPLEMGFMYSLRDMHKRLSKYRERNNCTQEEACFSLIFLDEEFRNDYKALCDDHQCAKKKYKLYKKFTNRLDELEEEEKYG